MGCLRKPFAANPRRQLDAERAQQAADLIAKRALDPSELIVRTRQRFDTMAVDRLDMHRRESARAQHLGQGPGIRFVRFDPAALDGIGGPAGVRAYHCNPLCGEFAIDMRPASRFQAQPAQA